MWASKRLLGPGHATCKPLPVPTQDGPNRFIRFKLRRVRRDYWNLLCFANSDKLMRTANELIANYKERDPRHLDLIPDFSAQFKDKTEPTRDNIERAHSYSVSDVETSTEDNESTTEERLEQVEDSLKEGDGAAEDKLVYKKKAFWIVYSKRFKESIHLLSTSDIAAILKSFHLCNRDSGEYVVAVLELKRRVGELDRASFLDVLWVLSKRLKQNTQKDFFKSMANHVPNILYSLSALDIVKVLWNLYSAGYRDVELCRRVYPKFTRQIDALDETGLSAACLAFGRFGYRNMELYAEIEPRISKNCTPEVLFKTSWGMFLAAIDVTDFVSQRTETLVNSLDKSPRWKVHVWKTILDSTSCNTDLKSAVEEYL